MYFDNIVQFTGLPLNLRNQLQLALRSGDTIASEVLTEAWLLLIEN